MEFVAVAGDGVRIYGFNPDEEIGEPLYTFPAVRTADGCVWSADGRMLGLESAGGVTVYNPQAEYGTVCEVAALVGGPVRNFYFSPMGNFLVTHERYVKDGGNNVGVFDTKTGEMKFSFVLKTLSDVSWPPLKWTNLETHCCRMVQDGVVVMNGNLDKLDGDAGKIQVPGIMAFELAPKGAGADPPHVAVCIAEAKGAPARCQIYRLDNTTKHTAFRTFFKAQSAIMKWNNTGTAVLVRTSREEGSGDSYYGDSHVYLMAASGEESSIVATPDEGAIHDVQWNPTQDEFVLLHGDLPCRVTLRDGKKGNQRADFGTGHRNTIRWDNFGRFVVVAGHGQLIGDTDFWDKPGKKKLGSIRMECCVVCGWAPDGRHFLGATTHPRMRVDNKVEIYDYCGQRLGKVEFPQLLNACWRPRPRGAPGCQDRPPSPARVEAAAKGLKAAAKPEAKKAAYRPPNARGGGGLAEQLRKELGSTVADSSSTMSKAMGGSGPSRLPPGAGPADMQQPGGGGGTAGNSAASRNARKKAGKEKAAAAAVAEAASPDAVSAALQASAAPVGFEPPARHAAAVEETAKDNVAAGGGADNPEVEKKVKALRKKLREIEKVKEKPEKDRDVLQKQKILGEADIIRQIRELGAEP